MSPEEYIDLGGLYCPVCHSTNIDADRPEVDMDEGDVFCQVTCMSCDSVWNDVYKLHNIEIIKRGK